MSSHHAPIEGARHRHTLAEVAARTGIWLPATTGTVTVRCPMPEHGHPDQTPSLRLYLEDGTWYCFACSNRAGDVVQWVEQTEQVGWRQAIEILDSRRPLTNSWARVTNAHPYRRPSPAGAQQPDLARTPPDRIHRALDEAWQHCTTGPLHARAVAYLAGRRIDITALEGYTGRPEAGHTPKYGPGIASRLLTDGFTPDELVDSGLAHRYPDGRVTDFYRDRVLVPVRDQNWRVAGLVGRNVGDPRWPKYKNPPHTAVYDKSVNLYQPLPVPRHPHSRIIVVEGTLDALAIACAAIKTGSAHYFYPVTQSGRELSLRQLDSLLRVHPGGLTVSFDGDPAGRDSTRRLAQAVAAQGHTITVVDLPEGSDPASWLAERGPNRLRLWTEAPRPISSTAIWPPANPNLTQPTEANQ
jgi:DNA primase